MARCLGSEAGMGEHDRRLFGKADEGNEALEVMPNLNSNAVPIVLRDAPKLRHVALPAGSPTMRAH
ncbi:MAG: hypothetical protein QM765_38860 [Myxococcales bacterium]